MKFMALARTRTQYTYNRLTVPAANISDYATVIAHTENAPVVHAAGIKRQRK